MRIRHLAAPFVLLYWQLGPIPQPVTEPDGSVHWSLSAMAAKGQWEDASFDCDGNLTGSEAAPYRDVGGRVDVELPQGIRFTAVAGSAQHTSSYFNGTGYNYDVTTWGGMVAWEGNRIGTGVGIVHDQEGQNKPSFFLRTGRRDHAHFLMEVEPLSETRMMAGVMRTGIGFKYGVVGLTFSPYYEKFSQTAVFGDFNIPVTHFLDVRLAGTAGPGIETSQWGFGAGLRLHH